MIGGGIIPYDVQRWGEQRARGIGGNQFIEGSQKRKRKNKKKKRKKESVEEEGTWMRSQIIIGKENPDKL